MSIDEAIAKYKEITNTDAICPAHCNIPCEKCVQESEQLACWLEELKAIKDGSIPIIHGKAELELHDKEIYNKAIDNIKEKLMQNGFIYTQHALDVFNEIAEQLKEGGENAEQFKD